MKKDHPVNVKTSIKALLLSLNVEDSDTLPDKHVGMASYRKKAIFHALIQKCTPYHLPVGNVYTLWAKCHLVNNQILLIARNTRFGNFAWKGEKHNSCRKFHFPWQILIKTLEMKSYLQKKKKNCLYTKTCWVRSLHEKRWIYWILCLIQTLRPEKIKK